jgi:hypothetical protein
VGDGRRLTPGAAELTDAMTLPGWVAEQPEVHLSPHLRAWLEHHDVFTLDGVEVDEDGAYLMDLTWQGRLGDLRGVRAAAYSLIGSVAETASYVRQRRGDGLITYEVATGIVGDDAHFDTHGHVLFFRIAGAI